MSTGKYDLYIPVYILRVSLCRVGTLEWMCQRPVATVTVAVWEVETSGELAVLFIACKYIYQQFAKRRNNPLSGHCSLWSREDSKHGKMGRRFPDGGLLRYRK